MHVQVYDAALTSAELSLDWYLAERGKANHLHDLQKLTREPRVLLTADLQALKETRHWLSVASLPLHDAGTRPLTYRDGDIEKGPQASKQPPRMLLGSFTVQLSTCACCSSIPIGKSVFAVCLLRLDSRTSLSSDLREVTPRRYGQRRVARLLPVDSVLGASCDWSGAPYACGTDAGIDHYG
jgi:hypothetical protein